MDSYNLLYEPLASEFNMSKNEVIIFPVELYYYLVLLRAMDAAMSQRSPRNVNVFLLLFPSDIKP